MTSSTHTIDPSSHVFTIPELAAIICGRLGQSDCARLMGVSRHFFHCAMPFVWDSVTGLAHLLALLPGVTFERRTWNRRYDDPEQLKEEVITHLPRSFDLSRLRLYAPCVRTLEALELPHKLYRFEGDFSALRNSVSKSGLLPNLQYLTLTDICETVTPNHINWLSILLCPTLRSVQVRSWYSHKRLWLDLDQYPDALSNFMQKCPELEVLEVFPRKSIFRGSPGAYTLPGGPLTGSQPRHSAALCHSMPYFQSLGQLTGSTSFLQSDTLSFLGNLPSLESLVLYGSATSESIIQPVLECETAFPALKHLELHHLDARLTTNLCSLKPLVSSLTSAVVRFPFIQKRDWNVGDRDPPQATISAFSLLSPQLASLTIILQGGSHTITLNPPTIEAFRRLPLRLLELSAASLAPGVSWNDVLATLPGIEVLRLSCSVEFQALEAFSQSLPRLRHLELRFINFEPMQSIQDSVHQATSVSNDTPICLEGELYMTNPSVNALEKVARYLSSIWPRVICANRTWDTPSNIQTVRALNDCISGLRVARC
ncbi:hypothetical protein FRC08_000152 [Ceratobasidium sp. 394]|nr:hypothetical protein FRC08_000152 [Ceratobasidium sp. 394]